MDWTRYAGSLLLLCTLSCGETIPPELLDYRARCLPMNQEPLHETEDDPHEGIKNVFACDVTLDQLLDSAGAPVYPYPDGTLIVKESQKEGQDFTWLIATAEKINGAWQWREYTRNFGSEDFVRLPVSEQVCIDCHKQVEAIDYIFTPYQAP